MGIEVPAARCPDQRGGGWRGVVAVKVGIHSESLNRLKVYGGGKGRKQKKRTRVFLVKQITKKNVDDLMERFYVCILSKNA